MGEFWLSVPWQLAKSRPNHVVASIRVCIDWMFASRGQAVNARHAGPSHTLRRRAVCVEWATVSGLSIAHVLCVRKATFVSKGLRY
jgi:hypothetical protein